jgi:murein DD-endopeptidase MepM/ murein hydrolase activator NlpD
LLVHEGHDFFSHHRRYNLAARYEADPHTAVGANLFAYDLMLVDMDGALYKNDPSKKDDWFSYGAPIFAPADGIVQEVANDLPENVFIGTQAKQPDDAGARDPIGFGNHVVIRHADGRVSWLLHMKPGSVLVKSGDKVLSGQPLGQVGFSGDSLFPHLHYTVTTGVVYPSQGVPSYFRLFERILGSKRVKIAAGQIDTGDLLESHAECR